MPRKKHGMRKKMTEKEIAERACEELEKLYPDIECSLKYKKPYELLFAARLSAQCTDARVNIVTEKLFERYPDLESFASADINELEEYVRPCGCYRMKAGNLRDMAQMLLDDFDGEIPGTMDDLLKLPGIGRKTANLIMGDVWGKPAIVTDTHCIRISNRLGLTDSKDPVRVENDLRALIPPEISSRFCHQTVQFGRDICRARNPECVKCPLSGFCEYYKNTRDREIK